MLVHRARDKSTRVFDFFVAIPGLGDETEAREMDHVDVDFSGGSTQRFHIGAASCAIPGAALGLETAHRAFGRLPWRDLLPPAIDVAAQRRRAERRAGVPAPHSRPDPAAHTRGA
jgi:gamma-glutamyltranspeptidase